MSVNEKSLSPNNKFAVKMAVTVLKLGIMTSRYIYILCYDSYAPTSKKLTGHIGFGLSVRACVRSKYACHILCTVLAIV